MVVMVEAHLIEALERFPEPVSLFNGFMIQPWKGRFVLTCYDDPVVTITPNELGGAYPARDMQYAVALVGERLLALVNLSANAYLRGKASAGGSMPASTEHDTAPMAVPAAVAAAAAMPASSLDDILAPAAPAADDLAAEDASDGIFDEFDSSDAIDNVTPPANKADPVEDDDFAAVLEEETPAPAAEPEPEPAQAEAPPAEEPEPAAAEDAAADTDDFNIDDLPDSVDIATDDDGAPADAEIQGDMPAADEPLDQSAIDDLFG